MQKLEIIAMCMPSDCMNGVENQHIRGTLEISKTAKLSRRTSTSRTFATTNSRGAKTKQGTAYCSHEAIYHYIYKEGPDLIPYLRKKHKKRRKRDMKTSREFAILGKTPLSERAALTDEYGHYEVDLVGSSSEVTILVVLEKRTRHLWLHKIQNKTAYTMKYALLFLFRRKCLGFRTPAECFSVARAG